MYIKQILFLLEKFVAVLGGKNRVLRIIFSMPATFCRGMSHQAQCHCLYGRLASKNVTLINLTLYGLQGSQSVVRKCHRFLEKWNRQPCFISFPPKLIFLWSLPSLTSPTSLCLLPFLLIPNRIDTGTKQMKDEILILSNAVMESLLAFWCLFFLRCILLLWIDAL